MRRGPPASRRRGLPCEHNHGSALLRSVAKSVRMSPRSRAIRLRSISHYKGVFCRCSIVGDRALKSVAWGWDGQWWPERPTRGSCSGPSRSGASATGGKARSCRRYGTPTRGRPSSNGSWLCSGAATEEGSNGSLDETILKRCLYGGFGELGAFLYIELGKHRGPWDFTRVGIEGQRRHKGGRADR